MQATIKHGFLGLGREREELETIGYFNYIETNKEKRIIIQPNTNSNKKKLEEMFSQFEDKGFSLTIKV